MRVTIDWGTKKRGIGPLGGSSLNLQHRKTVQGNKRAQGFQNHDELASYATLKTPGTTAERVGFITIEVPISYATD